MTLKEEFAYEPISNHFDQAVENLSYQCTPLKFLLMPKSLIAHRGAVHCTSF